MNYMNYINVMNMNIICNLPVCWNFAHIEGIKTRVLKDAWRLDAPAQH